VPPPEKRGFLDSGSPQASTSSFTPKDGIRGPRILSHYLSVSPDGVRQLPRETEPDEPTTLPEKRGLPYSGLPEESTPASLRRAETDGPTIYHIT
jgi:hypothetical protein